MLRIYQALGVILLGGLFWAQTVGWAPTPTDRLKVPPSVRNNPGSYRSSYTYFYHTSGGK